MVRRLRNQKMKLDISNKKAIERIIKQFPDEELKPLNKKQTIEYLANMYIKRYIELFFTNGEDYFRDGYWND